MRICTISKSSDHLRAMGAHLQGQGHQVVSAQADKAAIDKMMQGHVPDVLLIERLFCEAAELNHVEEITSHYPSCAVVLLCANHSPEFLIGAMRAGVREVLASPTPPEALSAAMERIAAKLVMTQRNRAKVLSFMSVKGGSGGTFIASNLGWELAERQRVLLIDLNLQFGDALTFVHDGAPACTVADVARDISRLDASLLASCTVKVSPKYSVLAAPADLAQTVEVTAGHIEAIMAIAAAQYDFIIIDVPRSLDPLALCALDAADCIYLVMQSALPDVRNANRLLQAFRSLGYPSDRTELVLNRYDRRAEIDAEQLQRSLGRVKVHTIANSYREVHASINHGEPLTKKSRSNQVARQLCELADSFQPTQQAARGFLGRLLRSA